MIHSGGRGRGHFARDLGSGLPALLLNFLTSTSLDSRITFSRGTNATLTDSTGRITYAPANLLTRSEEFDTAAWPKTGSTVTANATTAPNGTPTADKLVEVAAAGTHELGQSPAVVSGTTYSFSVYVKAAERTWAVVQLHASIWAYINLSNGAVGNTSGSPAIGVTSVGNGWYRVSITAVVAAATAANTVYIASANGTVSYTGDGTSGIFIWGAQLEAVTYQTTPSTYVATTSAAYYGPRFDYDPVTLAARGLLIEEARTNLVLRSEEFDNAAWIKDTATITPNTTVAPDGTTTADTLTGVSGNFRAYQTATTVASTTYTMSIYVKQGTSPTIGVDFINVAAGPVYTFATNTWSTVAGWTTTAQNAGNGWVRLTASIAATVTNAGPGWRVSGATTAFIWGAQLEAGAFATSYIPTVASTVTRNGDAASMTGTNFSTWYNQSEGTFVVDADSAQAGVFNAVFDAQDGTNQERVTQYLGSQTNFVVVDGNVTQASINSGATSANAVAKVASAYRVNDFASSRNGATAGTDTSGTIPTVDRIFLGSRLNAGEHLNGHIRTIAYFNTRLPNSQLQTLTT